METATMAMASIGRAAISRLARPLTRPRFTEWVMAFSFGWSEARGGAFVSSGGVVAASSKSPLSLGHDVEFTILMSRKVELPIERVRVKWTPVSPPDALYTFKLEPF